jgi:hypothetical protein
MCGFGRKHPIIIVIPAVRKARSFTQKQPNAKNRRDRKYFNAPISKSSN